MHHHQSDSDSSDDSMNHPPFMKSTMESQRRRQRSSMNEPTDELSDITHLREELNKRHEKISPKCNKHIKKMTEVVNEFENDFSLAFKTLIIGAVVGIGGLVLGLALAAFTGGASAMVSGLGTAALAGAGIGEFKKTQQEKNLRQTIEKELEEFQNKISPINMLEKICNTLRYQSTKPMQYGNVSPTALKKYTSSREIAAEKWVHGNIWLEIFQKL